MLGDLPPIEGDLNQGPQIISATGRAAGTATASAVSLEDVSRRLFVSVADQVALCYADLRDWMAKVVIPAFLWANGLTLGAIALLVGLDEINIAWDWIAPGDRIIGSQVIMTLLGATTVQVGAIAALIARYLFPGRQS